MDRNILNLVRTARVGRLATATTELQPYLTPVVFVLHHNSVFIPLDEKPKNIPANRLKRVKNIRENPKVSFLVDHYEEDWEKLWYIILIGHAVILSQNAKHKNTKKELSRVRNMLFEKYKQYTKIGTGCLLIKIKISKTIHWKFSKNTKNAAV